MKAILTLIGLLCISTAFAQNFEGKIIYNNTYKSKNAKVSDEQLEQTFGNTQEYYIKNDKYKSVVNGKVMLWQIYNSFENRLYNKMGNSDILFWINGAKNDDEVVGFKLNKGVTTVLGNKCDELVLTCNNGTQKYYFNSKFSIDPSMFSQHKYGNYYNYLSKAKAVPLKIIMETPQFILESTAVEIVPEKLNNKEFDIPAIARIQEMPS
jgi:hypothetical protein